MQAMVRATKPGAHSVPPEEIAKLWMSENAVVNQKTNYFVTATAFLTAALGLALKEGDHSRAAAYVVVACGIFFSAVMFSSIARTCVYREHLRQLLDAPTAGYGPVLAPGGFPWYAKIPSSWVLQAVPFVFLLIWAFTLAYLLSHPVTG
jgi:hypothetical protein